ncbi:hypothetical protein BJ912DRAFT_923453 [Pholiota molesta]|nr:hypothetical protein BJ912DRAFT_923453 [Pholiota molesta]
MAKTHGPDTDGRLSSSGGMITTRPVRISQKHVLQSPYQPIYRYMGNLAQECMGMDVCTEHRSDSLALGNIDVEWLCVLLDDSMCPPHNAALHMQWYNDKCPLIVHFCEDPVEGSGFVDEQAYHYSAVDSRMRARSDFLKFIPLGERSKLVE